MLTGQAQALPGGRDGVALTKTPAVVVVVAHSADARVALVREAVAHWNRVLAGIGSGFRLGPVSIRSGGVEAAEPGKIVVVLSDGVFISHVNRLPSKAISPLRRRMIEDIAICKLGAKTQHDHKVTYRR